MLTRTAPTNSLDEDLARLRAAWRAVARYRVYRSSWQPVSTKTILASGLTHAEAQQRAAQESEAMKARGELRGRFGDDIVGFELENGDALGRLSRAREPAG